MAQIEHSGNKKANMKDKVIITHFHVISGNAILEHHIQTCKGTVYQNAKFDWLLPESKYFSFTALKKKFHKAPNKERKILLIIDKSSDVKTYRPTHPLVCRSGPSLCPHT